MKGRLRWLNRCAKRGATPRSNFNINIQARFSDCPSFGPVLSLCYLSLLRLYLCLLSALPAPPPHSNSDDHPMSPLGALLCHRRWEGGFETLDPAPLLLYVSPPLFRPNGATSGPPYSNRCPPQPRDAFGGSPSRHHQALLGLSDPPPAVVRLCLLPCSCHMQRAYWSPTPCAVAITAGVHRQPPVAVADISPSGRLPRSHLFLS